eukprot:COSAG02_NODE_159_length_32891_cov_17.822518_18_plen_410_part_00
MVKALTDGCGCGAMHSSVFTAMVLAAGGLVGLVCGQERPPPPPPNGGDAEADMCSMAAQGVFEPCCGGEPGDPMACLTTVTTYAEMCSDRACTAALSAADTACAGADAEATASSQAYQTLRAALSCEGLDDPCVVSVPGAMTETCGLGAGLLGADAAQLQEVAQQNVCNSETCMSAMQTQMETCAQVADIGTQLILQLFASLLGTCGALAQPGTRCSAAEMDEVKEVCGLTAIISCTPECVNLVTERVGQCPLSFTDPAMVTLASTCGTMAAQPCQPRLIDELLSHSADCAAFSAAFTAASATPCAELYTNQDLAQAVGACSLSAVLPACEPGVVDELMDLRSDCQRFVQALSAAQCTDERLQAAVQECGTTVGPPSGTDSGPLDALSILNAANCPAEVNVGNFQRACW